MRMNIAMEQADAARQLPFSPGSLSTRMLMKMMLSILSTQLQCSSACKRRSRFRREQEFGATAETGAQKGRADSGELVPGRCFQAAP